MGITDLFKRCKFADFDIETFAYKNMGIDMYVLFHRCIHKDFAKELVDHPDAYIEPYYKSVFLILNGFAIHGYNLYLVYDGDKMNYKITEKNREQRREAQKAAAAISGDWSACVDVTPAQMYNFQLFLKEQHPEFKYQFVVAPFEADAQLAYLYKKGIINSVLTSDSDLIIYGVDHILFLSNGTNNIKYYIKLNTINEPECINEMDKEKLWIFGYLIRCDYFEGIKGIGIVKAFDTLKHLKLRPIDNVVKWEDVFDSVQALLIKHKLRNVIHSYKSFSRVRHVYTKQPIYDPITKMIKYLDDTNVKDDVKEFGSVDHYEYVCTGVYDPITKQPFVDKRMDKPIN